VKTCPVCDASHERRGIYCSPRCKKRAENARYRGTELRALLREFDCQQCGTHCIRGVNVAPHASKFCGYQCKAVWHHRHVEGKRPRHRVLAEARVRRALHPAPPRRFTSGRCRNCRAWFVSHDNGDGGRGRYCSEECRRVFRYRQRAHALGAVGQFAASVIGERDDWTCGICSEPVDQTVSCPHPMAATVDHIVPISRGGAHTLANVQIAHMVCNSRKRDVVAAAA
jgi:hypothetical protein